MDQLKELKESRFPSLQAGFDFCNITYDLVDEIRATKLVIIRLLFNLTGNFTAVSVCIVFHLCDSS